MKEGGAHGEDTRSDGHEHQKQILVSVRKSFLRVELSKLISNIRRKQYSGNHWVYQENYSEVTHQMGTGLGHRFRSQSVLNFCDFIMKQ